MVLTQAQLEDALIADLFPLENVSITAPTTEQVKAVCRSGPREATMILDETSTGSQTWNGYWYVSDTESGIDTATDFIKAGLPNPPETDGYGQFFRTTSGIDTETGLDSMTNEMLGWVNDPPNDSGEETSTSTEEYQAF